MSMKDGSNKFVKKIKKEKKKKCSRIAKLSHIRLFCSVKVT